MTSQPAPWWRTAVFYQVYLRSFADGSGDGVGDLAGLRHRLPYLADLGVDALWITPFYPSPMVDHGYDVADPRGVDPLFGDLAAFDAMVADAHALGIRVTVDVVPNHTSDQHPWFRAALAAPPGSPERDRYLFRDGRGAGGEEPPNNWRSAFGGPAWARVPDGQWYLHHFAPGQPDLDWRHPEVRADAGGDAALLAGPRRRRLPRRRGARAGQGRRAAATTRASPEGHRRAGDGGAATSDWDQEGRARRLPVLAAAARLVPGGPDGGRRGLAGRRGGPDPVRPPGRAAPGLQLRAAVGRWDAAALRDAIDGSLLASAAVGAATTWVLSNHDSVRHLTRYGGGEQGRRRARAAALLLLGAARPGVPLPGRGAGPARGRPAGRGAAGPGRSPTPGASGGAGTAAGCRCRGPATGRRTASARAGTTWLPQPADWAPLTVEAQVDDPASMLALYRAALATRRAEPALAGGRLSWLESPAGVLAFSRTGEESENSGSGEDGRTGVDGGPGVVVAVNLSDRAVPAPPGRPLLASDPAAPAGTLPPDGAVWVRPQH